MAITDEKWFLTPMTGSPGHVEFRKDREFRVNMDFDRDKVVASFLAESQEGLERSEQYLIAATE